MGEGPGVRALSGVAGTAEPGRDLNLRARLQPWLPDVFAVWLAGVLLVSVYHLGGWWQARRLTRRDTRPPSAVWLARLGELRARLGIGRAVELLESARVDGAGEFHIFLRIVLPLLVCGVR